MIYRVSFRIIVKKYHTNWLSVIHFTTGSDCCTSGYRIPAVWITPNQARFAIWSDVSGNNNYRYTTTNDFSFGMPYDITIQQTPGFGGSYWYEIIINGSTFVKVQNTKPKKFFHVKEYISNPWYHSFTSDLGTIFNLEIEQ